MRSVSTFKIPPFIAGIDRHIKYTQLTVEEAKDLWFVKWDNTYLFAMIKIALTQITDLTEDEFKKLTIQEAITLLFYYRLKLFPTDKMDGNNNLPADYSKKLKNSLTDRTKTISVNGKSFTPFIPLDRAIEAEAHAIDSGRGHDVVYFLLGAGFISGGYAEGALHILNSPMDANTKSDLIAYNELIRQVSNINLSIYNGGDMYVKTPDDIRIKILSTPKGGNEPVSALNFQEIFFFILNA